MKKISIFLGCVLAVTSTLGFAADKLKLAVDVPYAPFNFKAPDGTLTGFEVDLGNAACAEMKTECEWVIQAWDGIIPGLLARKYDAILSSMDITEERKEKVLFSEPYLSVPSGWFGKKGMDIKVDSKESLKGLRVGVQRGTVQDDHVTNNIGADTVDIKRYTTADDLVIDLMGGRIDIVLLDFPVGESTILKNEAYQSIGENIQIGNGFGIAFSKRNAELADKFNTALKTLKENGTYDKIMKKYFAYSVKI